MPDTDTRSLVDYLRYWSTDKTFVFNYPTLTKRIGEAATELEAAQQENARLRAATDFSEHNYAWMRDQDIKQARLEADLRASGEREERLRDALRRLTSERSIEAAVAKARGRLKGKKFEGFFDGYTTALHRVISEAAAALSEGPNRDPRAATEEQPGEVGGGTGRMWDHEG